LSDIEFNWILSLLGGFLSFLAVYVALETFFIQNWIALANKAKVAYSAISDLRRDFGARDSNILESGYRQIGDAIELFPSALILFSLVLSLTTIAISLVFYVYSWSFICENVSFRNLLGVLGLLAFLTFSIMIIALSVYSFNELRKLKDRHRKVRLFKEREKYRRLDEVE
jgi:multisubunit Na+/H+ antiporter MnhC subunit